MCRNLDRLEYTMALSATVTVLKKKVVVCRNLDRLEYTMALSATVTVLHFNVVFE